MLFTTALVPKRRNGERFSKKRMKMRLVFVANVLDICGQDIFMAVNDSAKVAILHCGMPYSGTKRENFVPRLH